MSTAPAAVQLHRGQRHPAAPEHEGAGIIERADRELTDAGPHSPSSLSGPGSPVAGLVGNGVEDRHRPLVAGLGRPETLPTPRPSHQRGAGRQVEILPLQPAHFARAHPRLHPQPEQGGQGRIACERRGEHGPQLGAGEGVHVLQECQTLAHPPAHRRARRSFSAAVLRERRGRGPGACRRGPRGDPVRLSLPRLLHGVRAPPLTRGG